MKELAFLTPYYSGARGNVTTTMRLKQAYESQGYRVMVIPYLEPEARARYLEVVHNKIPIHILHFTRFSAWLKQHALPLPKKYILTMGGTDIYVDIKHSEITQETYALLNQARAITFFTPGAQKVLNQRLEEAQLPLNSEVVQRVVPQGIMLPPLSATHRQRIENNLTKLYGRQGLHILLPSGLRAIKDILFLRDAWEKLAQEQKHFSVTVIGEALEESVIQEVELYAKRHSFFSYLPARPFEEMGEIYASANLVINTSIEEGQPTAICEAMGYGLPVMVRVNEGNSFFVQHLETGMIFQSQEEFLAQLKELTYSKDLLNYMRKKAMQSIEDYSPLQEIREYLTLIGKCH